MNTMNHTSEHIEDAGLVMEKWIDAIERKDINFMMTLYHSEARLWGIFSDFICTAADEIEDYFGNFFQLEDLSIHLTKSDLKSYESLAISSGFYSLSFRRNGELNLLEIYFSFLFKEYGGKWLIMNHHTSVLPKLIF